MKKISIFINTACALLFLSACDDDVNTLTVNNTAPVVLSELSVPEIELDATNTGNPAITFNWTAANYGQQTPVNYLIELSSDNAFTNPVSTGTVTGTNAITLSVLELNTAVGTAGLPPFTWNNIYARVTSSIGTQSDLAVISNVISFSVYPFFNYPFKDYYLVGDATQPGWNNNNNNPPLFRDASNPNVYHFPGYYAAGQFKVLEVKGLWQPQWGTNDGTSIDVNPGTGSDPGTFPNNNNPISAAGYYSFTIDYGSNSFTFAPQSTAGANNFTSIALQGSAVSSTNMTQSGFDSHLWYANSIRLTPGNLQFLTNAGSVWASTTSFSGVATLDGGEIPIVVEDDYDVWFNDLTGHYIMIPLNL